jgi:hypothetical protein
LYSPTPSSNVVKSPKSKKSTATTQSEVGQLLEDVKMFSKGLTSRDDVGITLDDLNRKVDRALSEIAEHFATTQKQKSSIEFQIKEIRARLKPTSLCVVAVLFFDFGDFTTL